MEKNLNVVVSLYALKNRETGIISHLVLANTFIDAKRQYNEDFNYFLENNPTDSNLQVVKDYYLKCDVILLCNIDILGGAVTPIGEIMSEDAAACCEVLVHER